MVAKKLPAPEPENDFDRLLAEAGELIIDGRLIKAVPEETVEPPSDGPASDTNSEVNDA
jgi:hypothetical protein